MQNYPAYLLIPYQVINDDSIEPIAEKLYGIIYWYTGMMMKKCFVSNATLAEMLRTSPRTIQNSLESLEKGGYIKRFYKDKSKRHRSEIVPLVTFQKQSEMAVTPDSQTEMAVTQSETVVTLDGNGGDQNNIINKKNKLKHTPEQSSGKEIGELIKSFEGINPACSRFYGNKNQRKAVDDLIITYTFDRVKTIIENTLPKTNKISYLPTITTPVQLRDKWSALEAGIYKLKNKAPERKVFL